MGTYAALEHGAYVDSYDLTTDLGTMGLQITKADLDKTTFGPGVVARSRQAGLEDVQASGGGPWQAGSGLVDPTLFASLGTLKVITQFPSQTDGGRAYFYQARDFMYRPFGNGIGELAMFEWAAQAAKGGGTLSAGAIAGYFGKSAGSVSSTGAIGSSKQMGAVGGTQFLYGALHLIGSAGTSITVVLESDDNSDFSSATTRITFGPLTSAGGSWGTRVSGAISDDWFRFRVTAITGTWTVAAVMGIK
jgi:hypothetical protein